MTYETTEDAPRSRASPAYVSALYQQRVEGTGPIPFYVHILRGRAIAMPFRGEEYQITSTYDSRADLPWVIYALREWLSDGPRIIRYWEDHLDDLQSPEGMAGLEAALAAEREADKETEANQAGLGSDGEPRAYITAEQVLANQRDELERIRQLNHDVSQGLQALEAAHPEAVAALDKVADEIQRNRTRLREDPTAGTRNSGRWHGQQCVFRKEAGEPYAESVYHLPPA